MTSEGPGGAGRSARDLLTVGLTVEEAGDVMGTAGPAMLQAAADQGVRVTAEEAAQLSGGRLADAPRPGSALHALLNATTDAERDAIIRHPHSNLGDDDVTD